MAQETDADSVVINGVKLPVVDKYHVEQTKFANNWYWGVQLGMLQSWGSNTSELGFTDKINPMVSLTVGKEITPVSEARLQLFYGRNKGYWKPTGQSYGWNSAGLYLAYLPNLTNIFGGYGERRSYNIKGVIGAGFESSWGYDDGIDYTPRHTLFMNGLIGLEAGLNVTFRINERMKLTVEATEHFLDDTFDHNRNQENHTWDGHLNVMVGLTYHFGKNYNNRHFQLVRNDMTPYIEKQQELENLKQHSNDLENNRKVETVEVDVDKDIIYTLIAFDPNATTVDRLQQANIFTTARVWESRPDSYIYITNSTNENDALFASRAESIKALLKERYNISDNNIKVVPSESDIRKGATQTSIIFIVNE